MQRYDSPAARGDLLIGALIVTHGNLANELLNAAQKIEAEHGRDRSRAAGVERHRRRGAREDPRSRSERIGAERGVIIFTDMFGGTPSNISLSFLEQGRVEIVTGVNLPMIVKFATMQQEANDVDHARARDQREGLESDPRRLRSARGGPPSGAAS